MWLTPFPCPFLISVLIEPHRTRSSSKKAAKKAPTPQPSRSAPQPAPPAAAPCYLLSTSRRPMGESEEIKVLDRRAYTQLHLYTHLNIKENLLESLLDIIGEYLPDHRMHTLHKEGICEVLCKIKFPPNFCVILDNAKYNKDHVGFFLWKAHILARARHTMSKRRKAQYAREKRKKDGAEILLKD
ncbi:uncharacterized protein LAJ45_03497 [Morchella importuna]|uniref:uncharacterized protein n=1 Tax=Morchella importuna TaxID=1174673 RepID=UPI001E8E42F1|nr:uncharacterized protein LAJ45_03497 [Morchella importuna]KAH8152656.1 hypothetical protein LAJ45_03497 [Morchella importuna]